MVFFDQIKEKINREINPEDIIIIDNSYLHTKHQFFDSDKFHLKIIIKSTIIRKTASSIESKNTTIID